MRRVRWSPIGPPRSPAGRTASTGSGSVAVTVNMSSVLRRRRPRCGASSMRGLTPSICPVAGLPRPVNAGSNTAADHVQVLQWALESLPAAYRPTPDDRGGPQVLVRCDSAGATHTFADACRAVGVGFSFGYAV